MFDICVCGLRPRWGSLITTILSWNLLNILVMIGTELRVLHCSNAATQQCVKFLVAFFLDNKQGLLGSTVLGIDDFR